LIGIFQKSLMLEPAINTHLELDPLLPAVMTDKNSMQQIFSNLFKNAAEAMPGGGNLYLCTRYVSSYIDDPISRAADSKPGHVKITIRDDGPGIPKAVKSNLFEPYVTSKGAEHAGLGLSIVYNTVKELKGTITCESDDKKGTIFQIGLPIAQHQKS